MFTVTLCYAVHVVRIVKMSKGVRHSRNLASFSLMKSGERSEKCNYGNHANYGDRSGEAHAITIKPGKWTCLLPHLLLLWRISRDFFWFFYFQICKHKLCISSRLFICLSVIIFYLNALESLTSNYICQIAFISISFWTLFKAYWFLVMDNRLRLGLS